MQYKEKLKKLILDENKVRKEILEEYHDNKLNGLSLCILCKWDCWGCDRHFENKDKCYRPIRELYDEEYVKREGCC